ncbi:hypothetical protein ACIQNG_24940 [Streptomyces sp. NPDC091377]
MLLIAVAVTALYDWSEDVADVADARVTCPDARTARVEFQAFTT